MAKTKISDEKPKAAVTEKKAKAVAKAVVEPIVSKAVVKKAVPEPAKKISTPEVKAVEKVVKEKAKAKPEVSPKKVVAPEVVLPEKTKVKPEVVAKVEKVKDSKKKSPKTETKESESAETETHIEEIPDIISASEIKALEAVIPVQKEKPKTPHRRPAKSAEKKPETRLSERFKIEYIPTPKKPTTEPSKVTSQEQVAENQVKKLNLKYSDEDLEVFRGRISDVRKEALEELSMLKERLEDLTNYDFAEESMIYSMHMAEQGSEAMEKEKTYAQIQRINEYLKKLDEALQRINDKTYGVCRVCGCLIAKERLWAVPITTLSASYKIHKRCPEDGLDLIEPLK